MNNKTSRDDLFSDKNKITEEYDLLKLAVPHHDEFQKQVAIELKNFLGSSEEPYILELGSGTGITTQEIVKASPKAKIIALDLEAGMQEQAKAKNISRTIEYVTADAYEYLLSLKKNSIDVVVSAYTLHNIEKNDRNRILAEIYRTLKSGGLFINADKIVPTDKDEYRKALELQLERFEQYSDIGKPELTREWSEHYLTDDQPYLRLVEADFVKELKVIGFVDIKTTFREVLEAVAR